MKAKIIVTSGYFNPLHKGHIDYFNKARSRGDLLFVIVNNDTQRKLKSAKEFMDHDERLLIIKELRIVDKAILSIDKDRTVCNTLKKIHNEFSDKYEIFFANGGDQNNDTIPEIKVCKKFGIKLIDGLGDKIQSSSWILKNK